MRVSTDRYAAHRRAVAALADQFAALPPGSNVRLGKKTSNLFRFRPRSAGHRLDSSDFNHVLHIDSQARTADVQGMVTYEQLIKATLPHGLMPTVVPQLKTITLGGAVSGLGIESTSFRHGLPHESVREMEILTGAGQVVTADSTGEHAGLFAAFPNSYGTLGYALRLTIDLVPVQPYVHLHHLHFADADKCFATIADICATGSYQDQSVDFLDGVAFSRNEIYLTLGRLTDTLPPGVQPSDYTGNSIYYRSIRERTDDHLQVADYLWRWDTDWFWCSRALGVQHPVVRRLWPRRWRRSDVYRRLVALDRRWQLSARVANLRRRPQQEAVIQDVEVPLDKTAQFLDFFHSQVGISPIWLCPLRLRAATGWPLYPLDPKQLYVNIGFWSTVPLAPGQADGFYNRLIEETVDGLGGHKSLYSTVHYSQDEFWQRYNGETYGNVKWAYDPRGRLPDLYDKCVGLR